MNNDKNVRQEMVWDMIMWLHVLQIALMMPNGA